jgi:hypothetical protein
MKIASPKGGYFVSSAAINYRLIVVPIAITVVIFLDDYSVPIPMFVAITDDSTVVISITIAVMPSADCYADRSDTKSNLLSARRHCTTNARNGCNYQSVFHHVLLILCEARWSTFEQSIGFD